MAKTLKLKLPKRVAGVKIPKSVRKGPIGQFLNSGAGQIIVAEALVAAVGALAVSGSNPNSRIGQFARHPIDSTRRAGRRAAQAGVGQAARISYAMREAAVTFRDAMEAGPPESGFEARETGFDDADLEETVADAEVQPAGAMDGAGKKKQPSTRAEPSVPL